MLAEGRRGFDEMKMSRFAAWSAVGGILLSAIFTRIASLGFAEVLAIVPTFAAACAISASGSLALARRARMGELADGRGKSANAKLTDH
jgi:hypothetical protein